VALGAGVKLGLQQLDVAMKGVAAGIHVLTATGVLAGFQALLACVDRNWELAFIWLAVANLIDGVDGPLARYFKVKAYLPRFSGERLDLIIDYFTYVIVPALMIYFSGRMPAGWALVAAFIVLMTSLFHFSDEDSKTEDGFFVGFPAVWNVIAFLLFVFPVPPEVGFAAIAICGALTFVPLKWVHPIRARRWRPLTILVLLAWSGASMLAIWQGLPATPLIQGVIAVCSLYLLACGLARSYSGAG
jgi:phosphatidylcholine synthase